MFNNIHYIRKVNRSMITMIIYTDQLQLKREHDIMFRLHIV